MPHTPPPWGIKRLSDGALLIVGPGAGRPVAALAGDDRDADAALIAQAPALAEAISDLAALGRTPGGDVIVGSDAWYRAQDVLHRARTVTP